MEDLQIHMNKSKATLIYLFQHFVNLVFSMRVFKGDLTRYAFYQPLMTISVKIIESAYLLGKQLPKEESCIRCLITATNYMVKASKEIEFYQLFEKSHKQLIIDFVLPHLVLTEREREDFEANELEYCHYSIDLVTARNSETPKAGAINLLVHLCTHIDGCLTFVAQILLGLIDVIMQKMDQSAALALYPGLKDVLESPMFKKIGPLDILDLCLLGLAALSHKMLDRQDLKFYLLISEDLASLAAAGLSKENLNKIINDMIGTFSAEQHSTNTLVYQAIHSLKKVIGLDGLEQEFRLQILNLIVPQISKNPYELFSEIVYEMMR